MTRFRVTVNAVTGESTETPFTPQEEADADAAQEAWLAAQPPAPLAPQMIMANLHIDEGEISSVKTDLGIALAIIRPSGAIRAIFTEPMPDKDYGWDVSVTNGRYTNINRQLNYIEVSVDDVTEPMDMCIKVWKLV